MLLSKRIPFKEHTHYIKQELYLCATNNIKGFSCYEMTQIVVPYWPFQPHFFKDIIFECKT